LIGDYDHAPKSAFSANLLLGEYSALRLNIAVEESLTALTLRNVADLATAFLVGVHDNRRTIIVGIIANDRSLFH
jgi:hypothetical protein